MKRVLWPLVLVAVLVWMLLVPFVDLLSLLLHRRRCCLGCSVEVGRGQRVCFQCGAEAVFPLGLSERNQS